MSKPKSDIKSGVKNTEHVKHLGGYPERKTQEQIEKANSPKKAPGSVRV